MVRYAARPGTLARVPSRKRKRAQGRVQATTAQPALPVNTGVLAREFFDRIPREEQYRTHYGKALDLQRIDYALRSAYQGLMRPMTDIGRETVSLDGHLSALLQKRLNRLAALDHDIQPATGSRIDAKKADLYAAFVRAQLEQIPSFRDVIVDLGWAVFDGRAASELDWRFMDREWWITALHWIHPRRLSFGPNRDVRVVDGRHETSGFMDIGFPLERVPYKFCVYRPRLFGDYPEREGLAPRALYWSFFARFGTRERMALLELFGRPWRVLSPLPNALNINMEGARTAFESVKNLNGNSVAQLPPGWHLDIHQPFTGAGQVSGEAIDSAQKVLSKLILGSTGTTDAVSTGLGSSIGDAHLSEEDLVIWSDARRLAEAIEDQITDAIIAVNFGPHELDHAPRFIFRTEPPISREAEANRIKAALEIGVPVTLEEAREKLGIQETQPGQPYLQRVQRPAPFGMVAPPPANEVVYPPGLAPAPGEVAEQPAVALNIPGDDGGSLPAPSSPDLLPAAEAAEDDPDLDGVDDAAQLAAKMTELGIDRCAHNKPNRCRICGIERVRDVELDASGKPVWSVAWKKIGAPSQQVQQPAA